MIFTWAMLVVLQRIQKSFVEILKLNFDQLMIWLKSIYFGERTQPLGSLCLWPFLWHFLSSIKWTVGNLYFSMSSISNHPNTTKIHCKCPCQRSGLSDHESQAKNPSEGRSPLEKTNMKWKTRRVQNSGTYLLRAGRELCVRERVEWEYMGCPAKAACRLGGHWI